MVHGVLHLLGHQDKSKEEERKYAKAGGGGVKIVPRET